MLLCSMDTKQENAIVVEPKQVFCNLIGPLYPFEMQFILKRA